MGDLKQESASQVDRVLVYFSNLESKRTYTEYLARSLALSTTRGVYLVIDVKNNGSFHGNIKL